MDCDIVGLQETRRSGQSALLQTGYAVDWSGASEGDWGGKKDQGGVGLALCKSIFGPEVRSPEFISDRLLKVNVWRSSDCDVVRSWICTNRHPTDTQVVGKKHAFWTALDKVVKEVPEHEHLLVLMIANKGSGRTGGGRLGSEECKVLGAYERGIFNDNSERLLPFSANHGLGLLNTLFFSTDKNAT